MKKHILKLMTTLLSLVLFLSIIGCGSSSGSQVGSSQPTESVSSQTTAPEQKEEIEIRIINQRADREDAYKEVFRKFNAIPEYAHIKISMENVKAENYYTTLNTAIQSGDIPDLFTSHGNKLFHLENYVNTGVCMELDELIDVSGYSDIMVDTGKVNGKLYMSPGAFYDVWAVFYNKGIFDKYGISVPKSFTEFEEICDKLLSEGITPMSFPGKNDSIGTGHTSFLIIPTENRDWVGDFIDGTASINDNRVSESLRLWENWAEKGYYGKDWKGFDLSGAILQFTNEEAAMFWVMFSQKTALAANPDIDLGAFYMPTRDGESLKIVGRDTFTGYSVSSKTKHADEALDVLRYLMLPESVQIIADVNINMPALEGVICRDELYSDLMDCDVTITHWMDYTQPKVIPDSGVDFYTEWKRIMQSLIFGEMSVDNAVEELDSYLH